MIKLSVNGVINIIIIAIIVFIFNIIITFNYQL